MSEADMSCDWRIKKPANTMNSASEEMNRDNFSQNTNSRFGGSDYSHRYPPRNRDHYRDDEPPRGYSSKWENRPRYSSHPRNQYAPPQAHTYEETHDVANPDPSYFLFLCWSHS